MDAFVTTILAIETAWQQPQKTLEEVVRARLRESIAFYRHKPRQEPGKASQAKGRANFAFADGHVSMYKPTDLYDTATGKSNFTALWSPKLDYQYP